MKLCLFGTFHGAFWTIQSGSGPEFNKEFDFEVKKIGLRSEKIILKEFAGKFGTHFLLIFHILGYKLEAPSFLQGPCEAMASRPHSSNGPCHYG